MINTMRAEWIKLRTLLVHWVLVVIAIVFPVGITVLVAVFADFDFDVPLASRDLADLIVGLSVVSAMLLGTVSVISLTSEYSHHTIRPTYAATPHRLRVTASKVIVNTVVTLLVATFIIALSWALGSLILNGRGGSISLGEDRVVAALVSVIVLIVLVAWFGFGLGLIIRNSPAAVTIVLLWPLIIENLIALVFVLVGWDGATKWLPYQAAIQAAGTSDNDFDDVLGRPWGLVYFGAVALVIVTLGSVIDQRRDA